MNEKTWVANLRMKNEGTCKTRGIGLHMQKCSRNAQYKCEKLLLKNFNIHDLNVDDS